MIESDKFKQVVSEFSEFIETIDETDNFGKRMCYLFEQALDNIKNEHLEIGMLLLCTVIESIAAKRNYEEYKTFDYWVSNMGDFDNFIKEIKETDEPRKIIEKWHIIYRETYGPRKNFINIIVDTYKTLNIIPGFMKFKTVVKNGVEKTTYRTEGYNDINEYLTEFRKAIGHVYDESRCPFAHQGKFLRFDIRIQTKIGGLSSPRSISLQDMATITFNVMKANINNCK
ncbi:MAG: hypothetical protein JW716_03830 [Candidatus Aenigmarchaeota archaeon]|nr:hypothetical protein [Candidatus Aenigmarchaeota archaeon]